MTIGTNEVHQITTRVHQVYDTTTGVHQVYHMNTDVHQLYLNNCVQAPKEVGEEEDWLEEASPVSSSVSSLLLPLPPLQPCSYLVVFACLNEASLLHQVEMDLTMPSTAKRKKILARARYPSVPMHILASLSPRVPLSSFQPRVPCILGYHCIITTY